MPTVKGEPEWLKRALEDARREGRLKEASVAHAPAGPGTRTKLKQSEAEFQKELCDYARRLGWKIAHFRKVRVQRKGGSVYWETPVAEDGKGFLDLELCRERLVKVELKVKPRKPSPEQLEWVDAYKRAGVEVYVWYPENWPQIEEVLR